MNLRLGAAAAVAAAFALPSVAHAGTITAPVGTYFDAPTSGSGAYHVVGSITPPSWSWGRTELLEGHQAFRTEGYNQRTEKLRYQDTYQTSDYPLQTYFGDLNQQLVDGFNLAYRAACGARGTSPVTGLEGWCVLVTTPRKPSSNTA